MNKKDKLPALTRAMELFISRRLKISRPKDLKEEFEIIHENSCIKFIWNSITTHTHTHHKIWVCPVFFESLILFDCSRGPSSKSLPRTAFPHKSQEVIAHTWVSGSWFGLWFSSCLGSRGLGGRFFWVCCWGLGCWGLGCLLRGRFVLVLSSSWGSRLVFFFRLFGANGRTGPTTVKNTSAAAGVSEALKK